MDSVDCMCGADREVERGENVGRVEGKCGHGAGVQTCSSPAEEIGS
jgi:hypothetical protein